MGIRSTTTIATLLALGAAAAGCSSKNTSEEPAPVASLERPLSTTPPQETSGFCASDCLGGACVDGVCQPIQLAGGQSRPWFLTVDGTDVYWTMSTFYQVNKASLVGGPITTIASGGTNAYGPTGIIVTGGYVIWASERGGQIWRAAPGSFQPDPVAIATNQGMPVDLATDGPFVYWANYGDGTIARTHVRPATGEVPEVLAQNQNHPEEVAVRGGYVYWTNSGGGSGAIARANIATHGAPERLADGAAPAALVVDDAFVYWVDYGAGTVRRVPVGGGSSLPAMVSGQANPLGLVVDAQHVYWSNYGNGTIMRSDLDGQNAMQIASGQRRPYSMAQDATAVYWVNDDWNLDCSTPPCGAVMKLAK